ncbi:MAG: SusD/RagB family nutrient-binding outer rane lipoprotein [Mucilaginibacter sp.]|nr:SusD/RagB family nutrient-binding outer rane lipoprotein [Mucilaginibacter sp.]
MKKYISIIFITLAIAGGSCKKDYLNLQNNPNVPSVAAPNLLLSGALKGTADIVNGPNMGTITSNGSSSATGTGYIMYANWVGYLSQSTGYQPFVSLEEYQFTTSSYDDWTSNYLNISNYNAILGSTSEPYFQAIAKIMIAFDFEALVDNYNNVPYTSALKGTANLNPTYDKGSDIYADLFKQLDAAISLIQKAPATALSPASADIMFKGNMTNWLKFANTLKLRLAIRESALATPGLSALQAEIASTNSVGYLDGSTAATVNPGYLNSDADGGQQSPLWRQYGTTASGSSQLYNAEYQANSFLANFYGTNSDPRLIRVYTPTATATANASGLLPGSAVNSYPDATNTQKYVVSTTFGDSQPPTNAKGGITPSKVGPGILTSPSMNAIIMSSEEALFLQAEALKDGYNLGSTAPASAQAAYNAAITASFVDLNAQAVQGGVALSPAASAAMFTAAGGAYAYPAGGSDAAQEQAIITQKWAALAIFGAFEAFNEERRTGYPNVPTSIYPGANAPNQVTRIFYPFVEYQTNAANVAAQGTIDKFTSKIFWAK